MASTSLTLPDPFSDRPSAPLPTWAEFAALPDARAAALASGALHGEMVDKVADFATVNGGGLLGLGRGALDLRAQQGMITSNDRDRMLTALEYLAHVRDDTDVDAVVARIAQIHQQMVDDSTSSLPALMVSSIMVDSVSRAAATDSDSFASGASTAVADIVTAWVTLGTGVTSFVITYTVSSIVQILT
jgi:hypothetical protein